MVRDIKEGQNTNGGLMELTLQKRVELLESLVNELLNENPKEEVIQKQMNRLSIEYTSDKVTQINRVLEALHPYQTLDFEETV